MKLPSITADNNFCQILSLIPGAVYTCDVEGRLTFFNKKAVELWGREPKIGDDDEKFCGAFRLWRPDGNLLAHAHTPMADALKRGVSARNQEVIIQRPDNSRITVSVSIDPLYDSNGNIEGAINIFQDITEKKQQEEKVLKSEAQLREILEALPAAVYTTDAEGRITAFNQAAVKFSGRTPQIGTDSWCVTWKLYWPDGTPLPHDECPMAMALKRGEPVRGYEAIAERPDGSRVHFIPYPTPLRDSSGSIIGAVNMLVDITDRKQAEEARAHLSAVIDSANDAILSKNLEGIITSWNKAAESLYGYTADEIIGRNVKVLVPENRHEEVDDFLTKIRRGEQIKHYETKRRRKDGSLVDISLTISAIKSEQGRITGASAIARDITDRKRAEKMLRIQARQQQTVAEMSALALSEPDLQKVFDCIASGVAKTLEVKYSRITEFLPNENKGLLHAGVNWKEGFIGNGKAAEFDSEASYTLQSDSPVIIEDLQEEKRFDRPPFLVDHGVISGMSCIIRGKDDEQPWGVFGVYAKRRRTFTSDDINFLSSVVNILSIAIQQNRAEKDLKIAHEELRQSHLELEHKVRERTKVAEARAEKLRELASALTLAEQKERSRLAQILHDHLQQLLIAIKITANRMRKESGKNSNLSSLIHQIEELTNESIESSRSFAVELNPHVLRDAGLITAMEWLARWVKDKNNLLVQVHAERNIKVPADDIKIVLFQSVRELLLNVVKHAGTNCAQIRLSSDENNICIEVIDAGKGFDVEILQKKASGFGLLHVFERLELLGGSIKVESALGKGSHFFLSAPAVLHENKPKALPFMNGKHDLEHDHDKSKNKEGAITVLVVDDHKILRQGLINMLTQKDNIKIVGEAEDGEEAIRLAGELMPDVIIMDVSMPKMNGIEATEQIKSRFSSIQVIGLSLHDSEDMEETIRRAGASAYIAKSGPLDQLVQTIKKVAAQSSQKTTPSSH